MDFLSRGQLSPPPSIPQVPDSLLPIKGTGGSGLLLPLIFLSDFLRNYIALESPLFGDFGEATVKDLVKCSVEGTEAMRTRAGPCQVSAYSLSHGDLPSPKPVSWVLGPLGTSA